MQWNTKSKLFRLKKWVTLADAARHLSPLFDDDVTEADVLQMALQGHFKLSVYLVSPVPALRGKAVPISEASYKDVPSLDGKNTIRLFEGIVLTDANGQPAQVVELEDRITEIKGIFNLPMIGNERFEIEQKFIDMKGGPEIDQFSLDGAFLESRDGELFQLVVEKEDTKPTENFYPADSLPEGSLLGAWTESLLGLEHSLDTSIPEAPAASDHQGHRSEKLVKLNQASTKFWANADPDDRTTHPDNSVVIQWLIDYAKYKPSLADKAATIIRPKWAPVGRKPEK